MIEYTILINNIYNIFKPLFKLKSTKYINYTITKIIDYFLLVLNNPIILYDFNNNLQ